MKRRIIRLPIVQLALVAVSVLVGYALAPVAAQTAAQLEGQVAIRSDGAVYLISGGQRHWVATVVISDDDLNAYPQGDPIYSALAAFGGGSTAAAKPVAPAASPAAGSAGAVASTAPTATAATAAGGATPTKTPDTDPTPEPTSTPDPNAQSAPVGGACPADKLIKGATQNGTKYYWEPDRPDYAGITPEACFTAGSYARDAGYKNSKNR
jgi:hypothetical protein